MPLVNSNTYTEPTAGTSLNTARSYYNDSLRSLLTNFRGPSRPAAVNLTAAGVALGEQDGMLYRSTITNALYISDSINKKSAPVGGNFTRVGIGHRMEANVASIDINKATYEIGELVGAYAEQRLYLRVSNTNNISSFIDIGAPRGYIVDGLSNAIFSGQSITAPRVLATSNVGINTTAPAYMLHVVGDAGITTNVTLGNFVFKSGEPLSYFGFPTTANTFVYNSRGSQRLRIDDAGNVGINTTATLSKRFTVTGDAAITDSLSVTNGITALSLALPNLTASTNLYFTGNRIETPGAATATSITVNYLGYNGGTTVFRNFVVYDGKTNPIATFTGSTGGLSVAGAISSTSDERLKTNIKTIDNALNKVNNLRGVYYEKDNIKSIGVIAQEIEKIIPEVVNNDSEYKSVSYGNLVGLLIEAIKELTEKVEKLA